MDIESIKQKISELAIKHAADDDEFFEIIEAEAENLIVEYSKVNGYKIDGFTYKESLDIKDDDEFDFTEQRQEYLELLAQNYDDIADLMWHYVSSFWPDTFDSKEEYLS